MKKALSNNVIHSIQQAAVVCGFTHLGVNRFSQDSRQVVGYYDFTGDYYSVPIRKEMLGVSNEGIFYYNTYHKSLSISKNIETPVENMDQRAFVRMMVKSYGLFHGIQVVSIQCSLDGFDRDTLSVHPTVSSSDFHAKPIDNVFYQNGILCLWMQSGIFMI